MNRPTPYQTFEQAELNFEEPDDIKASEDFQNAIQNVVSGLKSARRATKRHGRQFWVMLDLPDWAKEHVVAHDAEMAEIGAQRARLASTGTTLPVGKVNGLTPASLFQQLVSKGVSVDDAVEIVRGYFR